MAETQNRRCNRCNSWADIRANVCPKCGSNDFRIIISKTETVQHVENALAITFSLTEQVKKNPKPVVLGAISLIVGAVLWNVIPEPFDFIVFIILECLGIAGLPINEKTKFERSRVYQ